MEHTSVAVCYENCTFAWTEGQPVLDNLNLNLNHGGFYWIRGASGAGKSTFLQLTYGALTPQSGQIRVFEQAWADMHHHDQRAKHRRHIGVIFQDYRLLPHLSVGENIGLPLYIQGVKTARLEKQVRELLDWVSLAPHFHSYPDQLSGGEKQRIAIARAVIARPRLILADEPTGNVDPQMARRLMFLFEELGRLGTTIVIATHDEGLVQEFPHQQIWLGSSSSMAKAA
jgi:cell division transport system ATP-binding protein